MSKKVNSKSKKNQKTQTPPPKFTPPEPKLTVNQIRSRISKAKAGDQKALDELIKINRLEADRANKRLKSQANATPRAYAYQMAKKFLSSNGMRSYSKADKKFRQDIDKLKDQLLSLHAYNRAKTGYVQGAKEVEFANEEILERMGINFSEVSRELYADFLATDLFKEFKKFDSERAIMEGFEALKSGKTLEDLKHAWDEYIKKKEVTLDDVWLEFTQVSPGNSPFEENED